MFYSHHFFLYKCFLLGLSVLQADVFAQKKEYYIHPDVGLNISQLLERHGYPFENHIVQTEDGYLLGVHRIPYGVQNTSRDPDKPIALFGHGMVSESTNYVNNEPENSLGTILADLGYDVWMLNNRGNTHSRRHITLDPDKDKKKFWDFSWHEMGIYDLPNTIDYILNLTNQKNLFYFGHSEGGTQFFVMSSMLPEYNKKIRHMSALAPGVFIFGDQDIKIQLLGKFYKELQLVATLLNIHEFLSHKDYYIDLVKDLCLEGMETYELCEMVYIFLIGYSPTEFNMTLLPVHLSNSPSGFAVKQGWHYLQLLLNGGLFRQYDYGTIMNLAKYGQATPPEYNLTSVVAPVTLHYSKEDQLVNYKGIEKLATLLPNAKKRMVPIDQFTHLDYIWGNNVRTLIYDYIVEEIKNY